MLRPLSIIFAKREWSLWSHSLLYSLRIYRLQLITADFLTEENLVHIFDKVTTRNQILLILEPQSVGQRREKKHDGSKREWSSSFSLAAVFKHCAHFFCQSPGLLPTGPRKCCPFNPKGGTATQIRNSVCWVKTPKLNEYYDKSGIGLLF